MQFITVGRFVINASLIMSIEVYRAGNGSDVKVTGLEHAIRLSDQETEALIGPPNALGRHADSAPRRYRLKGW